MAVRELAPDEEVLPFTPTARELRPDEEVLPFDEDASMKITIRPGGEVSEGEEFVQERGPVDRFGRGANIGLAETFGAPVDFANFLLGLTGLPVSEEPFLGSQQLRRGFAALGIAPSVGEEDPDTLAGSMGRITGAATGFLVPVVGLGGRAATAVETGVRAAPTTVRGKIVQDIGRTAVETPGRFLAAEIVSAAGAGVGGFVAREKFPDSPAASVIGEIIGGITPAGVLTAARVVPTVIGINLARRLARPFTTAGGRIRAERRVQEAARDAERAAAELRGEEILPEAALTPAQRAGDEGLLSLERSVIESSEQLKGQADEQIAQATKAIRESVEGFGEHVPIEKTEIALDEARNYIKSLVDTRMRIAALKADERIAALAPGATRENANLIAREEIEAARVAVNTQVTELWNAVPETFINELGKEVPLLLKTKNSTDAYKALVKDTPSAQRHNIPTIAGKLLGKDEAVPEGFEAAFEAFGLTKAIRLGEKTTVKELQGLRSELLAQARKSRSEPGGENAARMAEDLAEAVLADLGAQPRNITGEAGEALRSALDATAYMKNTFDKGVVGDIRALDVRGALKVAPKLTLETTIGKGGPRARVEAQAILEAVDTPALRGAVEDFLLDDLQRRAAPKGTKLDPEKAKAFLDRQRDILEDFPELRTRIESAIEAGDFAKLAREQSEGLARRLNDPKVSRAAVFLKEPVEGAMERIAKSPKPDRVMRELIKQARRDTTGDALKGLKTGLGDLVLSRASTRTVTEKGDLLVSGRALKRMLEEGPVSKMFKTLFSPEEQKRMLDIADVAEKVEKAVLAKAKPEGIIADNPSVLFSTLARVAGAQIGRKVAVVTGGGTVQTPGIVSNLFKRALTAGVRDPARRLLTDAMKDEDLFAALLTAGERTKIKAIRKQLNAWLLSIGAEQLSEDEQ